MIRVRRKSRAGFVLALLVCILTAGVLVAFGKTGGHTGQLPAQGPTVVTIADFASGDTLASKLSADLAGESNIRVRRLGPCATQNAARNEGFRNKAALVVWSVGDSVSIEILPFSRGREDRSESSRINAVELGADGFELRLRDTDSEYLCHLVHGMAKYASGDWKAAVRCFTQAIDSPSGVDKSCAYLGRAEAYLELDDYEHALSDSGMAIRLKPNWAVAYTIRGSAYSQSGDYSHALADDSTIIRLKPNSAAAYVLRASDYGGAEEFAPLFADCNKAIQLDPDYAMSYVDRGLAYALRKDFRRAFSDLNQAVKLDPESQWVYCALAYVCTCKGDYDKAILNYKHTLRIDPYCERAYSDLGRIYASKKEYSAAVKNYDAAISLKPHKADLYSDRGRVYAGQKHYAAAIWDRAAAKWYSR